MGARATIRKNPRRTSGILSYAALVWLLISLFLGVGGLILIGGTEVSNTSLLIAVASAGAAGASVQAAMALVNYIGHRAYARGWTAYFLIRPLVGSGFAVLVYVALRAGLVDADIAPSSLNYYGILAVAAITGLASGNVTRKLTEIVDTLFDPSAGTGPLRKVDIAERETPRLDRYHGFFRYQIGRVGESDSSRTAEGLELVASAAGTPTRSETHWILVAWLQSGPADGGGTEIDVGEGAVPRKVRFVANLYPEDCKAEPPSEELEATIDEEKSSPARFLLTCPPGLAPRGLLELTQRGRTVAVVPIDQVTGPQKSSAEVTSVT
jgi:hypothetical protein